MLCKICCIITHGVYSCRLAGRFRMCSNTGWKSATIDYFCTMMNHACF